jgi:hypothetical protein
VKPEAVIDRRMAAEFPIREWEVGSPQVTGDAECLSGGEVASENWRELTHHNKNQTR